MRDAGDVSRSMCLSFTDEFALIDLRYEPALLGEITTALPTYAKEFYETINPPPMFCVSFFLFLFRPFIFLFINESLDNPEKSRLCL